jgi:hypothetical protein
MGREGAAQQGWLPHYLKKLFPYMSDDDREDLRSRLVNGDPLSTLTEDENDMIRQCRSAIGRDGADALVISYLPKLFPDMTEEAVADLRSRFLNKGTLTEDKDNMICRCGSAPVRERWLREWQPNITNEEIDHILQNDDLYDSVSSGAKLFVSTIQATNKP